MAQRTSQNPTGIREIGQPNTNKLVAEYDFAIDGGAVGVIPLRGDTLPNGAIVSDVLIHIDTILNSGGAATVSVGSEGAADLQSVANFNAAPFSTTGPKRATFTSTTAPVKTTADRAIALTVAAAALTGGRLRVIVEYWVMTA